MAIKPKSRAHEERIKALEQTVSQLRESFLEIADALTASRLRRWWQFWK